MSEAGIRLFSVDFVERAEYGIRAGRPEHEDRSHTIHSAFHRGPPFPSSASAISGVDPWLARLLPSSIRYAVILRRPQLSSNHSALHPSATRFGCTSRVPISHSALCAGDDARLRRDDPESFLEYGAEHGLKVALGVLGGPYAWALGLQGELDRAAR